jgi:predicted acyl esterase
MWRARLEQTPPFIEPWLTHQRRGAYWKHASVCEDYRAIQCPVYAVGGWVDGYPNAIFRLMEGLDVPRKALVGPWSHDWPQDGVPGPAIGFLQEAVRWWDYWLKGEDTGVMDEPMVRTWLQEGVRPASHYDRRPGRWVTEPSWPSPNVAAIAVAHGSGTASGLQATGRDAGEWCAWCGWGGTDNLPADQRWEDERSLLFDSDPLAEPIEILGIAEAVLAVSSSRPDALLVARLCDVSPDGASTLVTRGLLNLTHRDGHEFPQALVPGERYGVRVPMRAISYTFARGHRVRLALSPTYWPWAWPSPDPVELEIDGHVDLPMRTAPGDEPELRTFEEPEISDPIPVEILSFGGGRRYDFDSRTRTHTLHNGIDQMPARRFADSGLVLTDEGEDVYRIRDDDPLSAEVRCERRVGFVREDWDTRIEATSTMRADHSAFHVTCHLKASDNGVEVFERDWSFEIPRDGV